MSFISQLKFTKDMVHRNNERRGVGYKSGDDLCEYLVSVGCVNCTLMVLITPNLDLD